jgi:hypothetical protein
VRQRCQNPPVLKPRKSEGTRLSDASTASALQHPGTEFACSRDMKTCPLRRQLSPEAAMAA